MIEIPLGRTGRVALIDDEDAEKVSKFHWYLHETTANNHSYARSSIKDPERIFLHNLILPPPPGFLIDHEDDNGLNCQRSNLRIATRTQNRVNAKRYKTKRSSKYKGVFRRESGIYRVILHCIGGERRNLGQFWDEEVAARIYDKAAYEERGAFARLNFPQTSVLDLS